MKKRHFPTVDDQHRYAIKKLGWNEIQWCQYVNYVINTGNRILNQVLNQKVYR